MLVLGVMLWTAHSGKLFTVKALLLFSREQMEEEEKANKIAKRKTNWKHIAKKVGKGAAVVGKVVLKDVHSLCKTAEQAQTLEQLPPNVALACKMELAAHKNHGNANQHTEQNAQESAGSSTGDGSGSSAGDGSGSNAASSTDDVSGSSAVSSTGDSTGSSTR